MSLRTIKTAKVLGSLAAYLFGWVAFSSGDYATSSSLFFTATAVLSRCGK